MKINPKSLEVQSDVSQSVNQNPKDLREKRVGQERAEMVRSERAQDKVAVSNLGTALQLSLNPSQLADERRAKIELLKAQIKDGTYNPPLEEVARAVAQEISFEILAGAKFSDE